MQQRQPGMPGSLQLQVSTHSPTLRAAPELAAASGIGSSSSSDRLATSTPWLAASFCSLHGSKMQPGLSNTTQIGARRHGWLLTCTNIWAGHLVHAVQSPPILKSNTRPSQAVTAAAAAAAALAAAARLQPQHRTWRTAWASSPFPSPGRPRGPGWQSVRRPSLSLQRAKTFTAGVRACLALGVGGQQGGAFRFSERCRRSTVAEHVSSRLPRLCIQR